MLDCDEARLLSPRGRRFVSLSAAACFGRELRGKPIEANCVIVDFRPTVDLPESLVVLSLEIADVTNRIRSAWVNLFALFGFGRRVTRDIASVTDGRGSQHLDNIDAIIYGSRIGSGRARRARSKNRHCGGCEDKSAGRDDAQT